MILYKTALSGLTTKLTKVDIFPDRGIHGIKVLTDTKNIINFINLLFVGREDAVFMYELYGLHNAKVKTACYY